MSVWLNELAWTDVKEYLRKKDTILVPIGSTEQHGPGCAMGLDTYAAISLAEESAKKAGVLVTPPLWFGDSSHHLGFPGTISLRSETLIRITEDIIHSLVKHGFKKILIVNGHRGANLPALKIATKELHEFTYPDVFFAIIDPFNISKTIVKELGESPEFHVGEFETSQLLYKYPHLVKKEKLTNEQPDFSSKFTKFFKASPFDPKEFIDIPWSSEEQKKLTKSGAMSDSTKASVEKGKRYHEHMVSVIVDFIKELEKIQR